MPDEKCADVKRLLRAENERLRTVLSNLVHKLDASELFDGPSFCHAYNAELEQARALILSWQPRDDREELREKLRTVNQRLDGVLARLEVVFNENVQMRERLRNRE